MTPALHDDPVLRRFRKSLDRRYGDRVERVVLFGSRARGDARPDSDYDIAVFLEDFGRFGEAAGALAAIEAEILLWRRGASSTRCPSRPAPIVHGPA